ncbi:MAG: FAD-dependent oxidoreductase, partial [Chloroflexi bacterium]
MSPRANRSRCRELPGPRVPLRGRGPRRLPRLVARQVEGAGTQAVVVGAGPAGDAAAAGLRDAGFDGSITLVGAEPELPYERPHLSKGFLAGTVARDELPLRPAQQYRDLDIEIILGDPVVDLGVEGRRVRLGSGKTIGWDRLCIATGSDARRLDGFPGAMYLRELSDATELKSRIDRGQALEIVGAGFIGCEVAAVARSRGCDVRVHEALAQPLARVLGEQLGAYIARVHREHGVDLRLGAGPPPSADVVAVGSVPRTDLAARSGLEVHGGIVVDGLGRTSAEGVFAAGDVTRFTHPLFATRIRVEHFQTAQRQGFA